ncbi:uncharacterized protein A4U43_C03F9020 [Asparagus officinalis]|uniref:Uncharacterized protein n=1 Tax=Asparagus officinalis TaxID=4686 RepID=A0A5P1F8H2_ASPOF|nr:uncharacterized protein A4U43_C03F9020 [Asparagus officinalis]
MPEAPNLNPKQHKKALEFIETVTENADTVQKQVLSQILNQNACAEYLQRHGISTSDVDAFRRQIPIVSYEDIQHDIQRIANGDKSPILSGRPICEFLTSSGTSGGERKLMPTIAEEMDRRSFFYSLQIRDEPARARPRQSRESRTGAFVPGRLQLITRAATSSSARSTRSPSTPARPRPFSAPTPTKACTPNYSVDLLKTPKWSGSGQFSHPGLSAQSGTWRPTGQGFAVTFGPEGSIRVTDPSVRAAVERVIRPDPILADNIEAECRKGSWKGIIQRIWPNTKYIEVIVTGAMAQYIPTLDYYSNGLPLACTMYGSSECYFGLNLNPMCKPNEVTYTLIPTMAYFEFLPTNRSEFDAKDLVPLTDVKLGHEYELVVTTYSGLYRYQVGDVLRVAGFKNKSPQFSFIRRKNVALSIDSDKTDEVELHNAVTNGVNHLEPFGATLVEYTSYADTTSNPGHYVLYWELREGGTPVPPSVFEDCCLAVEESLNSVYRQGRASDKSIGPLEIRIVEEGAFDKLMDYALSQGASINQYKAPRCLKSEVMIQLMNGMVKDKFFSPKCPKWVCGHKQWIKENGGI